MEPRRHKDYSDEALKKYIGLPVKKKLARLEETNQFFDRFMPDKNKKIWLALKKKGF